MKFRVIGTLIVLIILTGLYLLTSEQSTPADPVVTQPQSKFNF